MKPKNEELLGQLIDFWYRRNVTNIDLQRAVEGFLTEGATDETLLFSTFYHEDAMCDAHSRHVEVKIDWDGITIVFLIDFIHRDFTAQVRYTTRRLEEYHAEIVDFQGDDHSFESWINIECSSMTA